jgi:hypothetical protein
MMKRLLVLTTIMVFCVSTAHGLNIMLISDSGLWRTGSATPEIPDPETDKNKYVDTALVEFLEGLGYTVDTSGMAQAYREPGKYKGTNPDYLAHSWMEGLDGRLAALQDADMVILSRFADSGSYDDDRKAWNELNVPILMQNGHMARGSGQAGGSTKWGWNDWKNAKQSVYETDMIITAADHPFVEGFSSPIVLFNWVTTGQCQNAAQNALGNYPAGSIVVGTYDNTAMLVDIPAGTDFDALNGTTDFYGVAGARRVYFGHWTYDGSSLYSWDMDITDDYKALFAQVVALTIPEPATIALLGFGGLALLRRRS